jgi:sec-independent protein translocase protein TatA
MGIGFTEGVLIAVIVLFFFGGKKIPQLGKTLGESMKGFKEGMKGDEEKENGKKKNS